MISEKLCAFRFVFIRCFVFSFVGLIASYFILQAVFRDSPIGLPFYTYTKIIAYWDKYPVQYIGVVCFCYAVLASLWTAFLECGPWWFRALQICSVLIANVFFSSFACGALWAFHDMQAGYFPARMWGKVWSDAQTGLSLGPSMIGNSFPLNLIALIVGYTIIDQVTKNKPGRSREDSQTAP